MGGATDKALAQNNEGRKVGDGIRREVMELSTKMIHDAFEERVGGQRETSVNVAEEQDAFPLPWRRLNLVVRRQPPRLMHELAVLYQLQQIPVRHCGGEKVSLDPSRWQWPLPPLSSRRLALLLPGLHLAGLALGHGGDGELSRRIGRERCMSARGGEEDGASKSRGFGERNRRVSSAGVK